jgi:hypothetical protein
MNNQCYKFETLKYSSGKFDKCTSACYVITMENSKRRNNYLNQLKKYKPFSKVIIVHNKGYKKCKKGNKIKKVYQDLNHAYKYVFKDAIKKNYKSILVFEDDFFFAKQIDNNDINTIYNVTTRKKNWMTFNLGPLPRFMFPINHNLYIYIGQSSHGVFYSKKYMKSFIKNNSITQTPCDSFWNNYFPNNYCLKNPICFQKIVSTINGDETKKTNMIWAIFSDIMIKFSEKDPIGYFIYPTIFARTWWKILIVYLIYILKNKYNNAKQLNFN